MPRREPEEGVEVELSDGSWAYLRQIHPSDRDTLRRGFEALSPDSRYRRFLTPMERLSESQLTYLTEVDHREHEAVIALSLPDGDAVGVGRFIRDGASNKAEAAVTVLDSWQGRGLGTALTRVLAGRALEEGMGTFIALLLADNDDMVGLLRSVGPVEVVDRDRDAVSVEVPLDHEIASDPALRAVLRAVATTPIEMARRPGADEAPD